MEKRVSAVLVAAGSSTRMGFDKLSFDLGGETVLRRSKGAATEEIRISGLTVRMKEGKVLKNGQEVILTALEYKLLLTFLQNRGRVLSRNMLLESIWDVAGDFVSDNTLSVYIKRLREKIEDDPVEPQIIKTVRGMGYKVDE